MRYCMESALTGPLRSPLIAKASYNGVLLLFTKRADPLLRDGSDIERSSRREAAWSGCVGERNANAERSSTASRACAASNPNAAAMTVDDLLR